jgi:hypothetical protein
MVSDKPHLVPIEIVEEFEKGVKFQDFQNDQLDTNYFKKNGIEQLSITSSGDLVVKNSAGQKVIVSDNNLVNKDLQAVKNYLLESGKTSLNESQLNSFLLNRDNSSVPTSNADNNRLGLGLTIGGILISGLFIGSLIKKRTVKKT